jgi:protein gp37
MEPNWARDLRDQCRDIGAVLFLKQREAIPADLLVRKYPAV